MSTTTLPVFEVEEIQEDQENAFSNVIIPVCDIWESYEEDSRALVLMGLGVKDLIKVAIGFAVATTHLNKPRHYVPDASAFSNLDVFSLARNLILQKGQAASSDEFFFEPDQTTVYRLVDMIGHVAEMLTSVLLKSVGRIPYQTRLLRFLGRDIVLQIPTEA